MAKPSQNHNVWQDKKAILDPINRKILHILQRNSRASTNEIAKEIGGISKVAIAYRIKKLVSAGIIRSFGAKISGDSVGRGYVTITRITCSVRGPTERELSDKIALLPGVQSVYQTFGPHDILAILRTKDKESARDLIYQIYKQGNVESTDTIVAHTVVKESVDVDVI
jgi:DNA-binding Lrp family transcriptional regulator